MHARTFGGSRFGDREAVGRLLTIAAGDLPAGGGTFLRVKAAEALGRIHAPEAVVALKRIVESRKMFGWAEPQELRIAAVQALEKLDPVWAMAFIPKSGLDNADLISCRRHVQRRITFVNDMPDLLEKVCRRRLPACANAGAGRHRDRDRLPGKT